MHFSGDLGCDLLPFSNYSSPRMKWLFTGWLQFHLCVLQEEGQSQKCPFNFSNSKDRREPQHNYSQRVWDSTEKVLQVHWGHKELNSRNHLILSAAFYPQHWPFNSPEPFRCISRADYCCSRQVICRHAGDLLGSCLLLLLSDPAPFFAFQFPEHPLCTKKRSVLLLLLSQQLLTESQQYKRQQTQRQPLF